MEFIRTSDGGWLGQKDGKLQHVFPRRWLGPGHWEVLAPDHFAGRNSVFVRVTGGIGDCVTAQHVCRSIRDARPDCEVVLHLNDDKEHRAEWCALLDGATSIVHGDFVGVHGLPMHGDIMSPVRQAEIRDRCSRRHLDYYTEAYGVSGRLAPPRPIDPAALEWAKRSSGDVVLAPWASIPLRSWPLQAWLDLQDALHARGIRTTVLDGPVDPKQKGLRDAQRAQFRGLKAFDESAQRVAALCVTSALVISNDSGVAHVAGALGARVLVLSAMNPGERWYGIYPDAHWIDGALSCSPCCEDQRVWHRVGCHDACFSLAGITVQRVLDLAVELSTVSLHRTLQRFLPEWRPRSYLEIGVRDGDSLRIVLEKASIERLVLCDNWSARYGGTGRGDHQHIAAWAPSFTRYLDGDSKETVPTLAAEQFELVTVDGDHSEQAAAADLENVLPLVAPGGRIAFDDVAFPGHEYLRGVAERFATKHADLVAIEHADYRPSGIVVFKRLVQPAEVAVLSAWDDGYDLVAALTWPRLQDYAQRRGYAAIRGAIDPNRPASWSKIPALLDVLERYAVVLWIDADAMVTGDAELPELLGDADVVAAHDRNGLNAGVLLLRSCGWIKNCLRRTWDRYPEFAGHPWWEQKPLAEGLQSHADRVRVVPQRQLNAYPGDEADAWQPGDFIAHVPGMPVPDKLRVLGGLLADDQ